MEEFPPEDELESRQGAGLYPVGRALRATYDAENHESLGTELTGLMLELARIDPDKPAKVRLPAAAPAAASVPPVVEPAAPPAPAPAVPEPERPRSSWWQALFGRGAARS